VAALADGSAIRTIVWGVVAVADKLQGFLERAEKRGIR
jgi:hypothetical protein